MKIGQFVVSGKDGSKYQIRRLRCFNGVDQIGIGRKGICWINVEDFEVYKKVKK